MMAAQEKKKLVEVCGIFESILTQNPNQDSELSLFFLTIWKTISKSKKRYFRICFTKLLMPFTVLQTFKVKLLLEKSLSRYALIHLKTKVTPWNPLFLYFVQHGP